MLLEFGITVRDGVPNYKLTRDALSLERPDGKTIPLPSVIEFRKASLAGADHVAKAELSYTRGCVGRLYFQIPGGITYGQHWLNVKFQKSVVRVPFRILTKDEEKLLSQNYKDIRRQVEDAFKKKG